MPDARVTPFIYARNYMYADIMGRSLTTTTIRPSTQLTDGAASVGPDKVDLGLGDGPHADLVEGPSEEGGKGAAEDDVAVPAGQPDAHAHQVLLGDEALHVALREGVLVGEREGGVLGVPVQGYDAGVALAQLDQGVAVDLTGGAL